MQASLWCTNSREIKATFDGHSQAITDIRFSPSMLRIATSSLDKTVRIWDIENVHQLLLNLTSPGCAVRTFTGHTTSVMSIDFHPKKDLICSCDENEIRYWAIKNAGCVKVAKGGANLVRFQSGVAKHIAVVVGKTSICWDSSGERLISVSEDLVKVWRVDSMGKANCVHELSVTGKRFRCGIFHPCYPSLLVIGCYQSMELWNMAENKMMMPIEEPVSALAVSTTSGLIASAGHNDNVVKLWK
ncbi:WD40 repeat-containing protein [Cynara cardunculus var. scolymus]|uniref:WD40 repeat-containing protein n=1 Tax=Cynara cardunculus var. scolymus TaxID=59895 RepID=A0A103XN49_CYNCS|nr:WD40 repeat-containing protein [Cynara cardunculus var. scolymus]